MDSTCCQNPQNTLSDPFEAAVSAFIDSHALLRRGPEAPPVVVGVSGGADSVALLFCLRALGFDVRAAHCNFHLRGDESTRDMRAVDDACRRAGIELYIKDFDVDARVKATGESIEMACRSLRYRWFADLVDRERAQALAVGHHREDQAETVLLNLIRGTGPAGLAGMKPRRDDGPAGVPVVRPLLECSRAGIEAYLTRRGIAWITDSSNLSDDYLRNRLRNRILPLMEELIPGAASGILRTAAQVADATGLYDTLVDGLRREVMPAPDTIDLRALDAAVGPHARMALWELIRPSGFNMTQAANILEASSGAVFTAKNAPAVAELSRGILRIGSDAGDASRDEACIIDLTAPVVAPVRFSVEIKPVADFASEPRPDVAGRVAFFDAEALEGNPRWEIRRHRRADRITPFGMRGSKLVSDVFAEARLSAAEKREAWLLTRDGRIVWVIGLRNSALFPVTSATRRYLRLEMI